MQVTDQINHSFVLKEKPKRIISLVPSQSEFLWDIGLRDELVGITKFCIHPEEMFRSVTRIGGTKQVHLDKIEVLNPDLIIANKEENDEEQIKALQKKFPVWTSDIFNLKDAYQMMESLSKITGKEQEGNNIIQKIKADFEILRQQKKTNTRKKALYLIWKNPYMAAGTNTFINEMLEEFGFTNAVNTERYPEITLEEIQKLSPDLIFLSSEPYPFKEKDFQDFENLPDKEKIKIVDGEIFSWYGSRLQQAYAYFSQHLSAMR